MFALNWLTGFREEDFLNIFPIGSYVKTMSTDGAHLGWSFGSKMAAFSEHTVVLT
jgi:hypothetical protein